MILELSSIHIEYEIQTRVKLDFKGWNRTPELEKDIS